MSKYDLFQEYITNITTGVNESNIKPFNTTLNLNTFNLIYNGLKLLNISGDKPDIALNIILDSYKTILKSNGPLEYTTSYNDLINFQKEQISDSKPEKLYSFDFKNDTLKLDSLLYTSKDFVELYIYTEDILNDKCYHCSIFKPNSKPITYELIVDSLDDL